MKSERSMEHFSSKFAFSAFLVVALLPQMGCESILHRGRGKRTTEAQYSRQALLGGGDGYLSQHLRVPPRRPDTVVSYESYAVVRGDSYWAIAHRFNVPMGELLEANGARKEDVLRVGQVVQIPIRKAASADENTYVVQRGDTLSAIARKWSCSVSDLRQMNGLSGDRIQSGQRLRVPKGPAISTEAAAISPKEGGGYVVRRGDTLSLIASSCGMTLRELMEINGITDPNRIREGQTLQLAQGHTILQRPASPRTAKPVTAKVMDDDLLSFFDDTEMFNFSN